MDKLDRARERLPEIVQGRAFMNEMRRFLPMEVQERTLLKAKFLEFRAGEISDLLGEVRERVG